MRYEDDYRAEKAKSPARKGTAPVRKRPAPDSPRASDSARPKKQARPATGEIKRVKRNQDEFERGEYKPRPKAKPAQAARPRRTDGARYDAEFERPRRPAQRPAARRVNYDDEYRAPVKKRAPARGKKRAKASGGMTFLWIAVALALAFALSTVLHTNVFEVVRMSGDSMYATVKKGDIVLVDKLSKGDIQRGELVAVKLTGGNGYIIRRVVGLPGETIAIESGKTYIDGNPISERYIGLETYDSFEAMTMPRGKYYVLCDNRTDLSDSRASDISMVDASQIDGKVSFRIWPFGRFGSVR